MIKFKKIIQKAAGPGTHTGVMGMLLVGAPAAKPGEAAPAAEKAVPTADEARQPSAEESFALNDELVESVLDDIFPDEAGGQIQALGPAVDTPAEAAEAATAVSEGPTDEVQTDISAGEETGDTGEIKTPTDEIPPVQEPPLTVADTGEEDAAAVADALEKETLQPDVEAPAAVEEMQVPEGTAAPEEPATQDTAIEWESPDEEKLHEKTSESVMADVDRLLAQLGQVTASKETTHVSAQEPPGETPQETAEPSAEAPAETPPEEASVESEPAEVAEEVTAKSLAEEVLAEAEPGTLPEETALEAALAAVEAEGVTAPAQAVSDEEREALLAEEPAEGEPAAETGDLVESISTEIDEALTTEDAVPAKPSTSEASESEIELDFSPEAVGLEETQDDTDEQSVDVNKLLSQVLGDLEKLGPVEKPQEKTPQEEPEDDDDSDFSGLLGGGGADPPADEDSAPQEETDKPAADTAGDKPPTQAVAQDRPAPPKTAPPTEAEEEETEISEEDLINQALQEALGSEIAPMPPAEEDEDDEEVEGADTDNHQDSRKDQDKQEGEPPEDTPADDSDKILANIEASIDAAEQTDTAAEEPDEENIIQQEVLSRSREVEQAVLDELFGSDDKEFREEIKTNLAQVDDNQQKNRAGGLKPAEPAAEQEVEEDAAIQEARDAVTDPYQDIPLFSRKVHGCLLWIAYQMNKPFLRWLTPARRRLLTGLTLALVGSGFIWLTAALANLFYGQ